MFAESKFKMSLIYKNWQDGLWSSKDITIFLYCDVNINEIPINVGPIYNLNNLK